MFSFDDLSNELQFRVPKERQFIYNLGTSDQSKNSNGLYLQVSFFFLTFLVFVCNFLELSANAPHAVTRRRGRWGSGNNVNSSLAPSQPAPPLPQARVREGGGGDYEGGCTKA